MFDNMFDKLPCDILRIIVFNFTKLDDVLHLSNTNKNLYIFFDHNLYTSWGHNLYTIEFWEQARKRTPAKSKPMLNMKMELIRINNFEMYLTKLGYPIWTRQEYFLYWRLLEMCSIKLFTPLKI